MEYYNSELYHYGVKGMKWGVRKKGYVTVAKAQRNAAKAANEARKKSLAESRASGDKGIGSFQRANRKALNAKRKAYGESIAKDRAYNKQLRDKKKAVNDTTRKSGQPIRNKDIDAYYEQTKKNADARKAGYAMIVAGTAMKHIGQRQYNQYKYGSTPLRTAVINGMGYGGNALQTIGTMAVGGSMIKQYADYKKYW